MQKNNNLITKFRELWNSLRPQEQMDLWDIMSAIRGADTQIGFDVKSFTTSRIRGELLGTDCHRGFVYLSFKTAKLGSLIYSASKLLKSFHEDCDPHFIDHIQTAIEALNKYRPKKSMRDLQKFLNEDDRD